MYQAISSVIRLADKMTKTLTLAGSLPRLLMVIPGGGGRGILTLILFWVMEELTEGHVTTLLVLVIKVTPGDVAAGVHGVHALIGPDKPILASGHPLQFLEHYNLDKSDGAEGLTVTQRIPRVGDTDESEKIDGDEDVEHPKQEDGWCLPPAHDEGRSAWLFPPLVCIPAWLRAGHQASSQRGCAGEAAAADGGCWCDAHLTISLVTFHCSMCSMRMCMSAKIFISNGF